MERATGLPIIFSTERRVHLESSVLDEILFGNAFASEEELKAVSDMLKEIYVYENTVIMYFDQKTFDSIDTLYNFDRNPGWTEGSWKEDRYKEDVAREFKDSHTDGWATTVSGNDRICIVKTFYSEEKKKEIEKDPKNYFGRGYISILGRDIDFNDGDISLYYEEEFNYDITREHRQKYDLKTGKWSKDDLNEYYWDE